MGIGAAILGAGAVAGAAGVGASIIGSNAQENAARTAAANQMSIYQQNQQLLNPYVQGGLGAYSTLNNLLGVGGNGAMQTAAGGQPPAGQPSGQPSLSLQGYISSQIAAGNYPQIDSSKVTAQPGTQQYYDQLNQITQQAWQQQYSNSTASLPNGVAVTPNQLMQNTLQNLPGYQFANTQGQKSVQNNVTSRGLGVSGAAYKGGINYAEGLANTYFPEYAGLLQNSANTGMQAGSSIAGVGQATGANIGASNIAGGNAAAAGALGVGNSIANAANGIPGNLLLAQYLGGAGGGGFGGGGGGAAASIGSGGIVEPGGWSGLGSAMQAQLGG